MSGGRDLLAIIQENLGPFLGNNVGKAVPYARHDQGFYPDGTNSGYFSDGISKDKAENLNRYDTYKPKAGEMSRKPEFMKEAEKNVAKDFRGDNYHWKDNNCHHYKEAVNDEYAKILKERGL